jgi:hypothetical protein
MDYDGKNMKRIAKMPGIDISYWKYDNSIDWHSLDRFVLSMACKGVWIFNLVTNDLKKILDGSVDGYQANVVWNKEGDRIAYSWIEKKEGEFTRESYICDLKRNTTQKILDKSKNPLFNPTDSNRIACTEVDAVAGGTSLGMRLVNISDGGVKEIGEKYQGAQKWSPNGKWLILAGGHSKINIETGEERVVSKDGGGIISPDERMSVGSAPDTGIEVYWTDKNPRDEDAEILYKSARIFKSHFKWWVKIQCKIQENI